MGIWTETLPGVEDFGPEKGLSSEPVVVLSISRMFDQPIYDLMPLMVSLYVCSSPTAWSGSVVVQSWSSESSPSSAYKSTGGLSEKSLPEAELALEELSRLCLYKVLKVGEPVSVARDDLGRSDWTLLVEECLGAEGSVPACAVGRFQSVRGWLADCCTETEESLPVHLGE